MQGETNEVFESELSDEITLALKILKSVLKTISKGSLETPFYKITPSIVLLVSCVDCVVIVMIKCAWFDEKIRRKKIRNSFSKILDYRRTIRKKKK